jgi:hypothetical protein
MNDSDSEQGLVVTSVDATGAVTGISLAGAPDEVASTVEDTAKGYVVGDWHKVDPTTGAIVPVKPESNQVSVMSPMAVSAPLAMEPPDLVAQDSLDMQSSQTQLIAWLRQKVAVVKAEVDDCTKWKHDVLDKQVDRRTKDLQFYEKLLAASEAGYHIVPSFPVTLFAIRTKRKNPLGKRKTYYHSTT